MVIMQYKLLAVFAVLALMAAAGTGTAVYTVTKINTTLSLNLNTTGSISEAITIWIPNASISQYVVDRSGLNLTLSNWQSIVGSQLVPHIINQRTGIYGFRLLPGPVVYNPISGASAIIYMNYYVNNATFVNKTGPRTYVYKFNPSLLNFAHGSGGVVLGQNTRLTIMIPNSSTIEAVYPLPDSPEPPITNTTNVGSLSWYDAEPLYHFNLVFQTKTSLIGEVVEFFGSIYSSLGAMVYVIIAAVIVLLILYTYFRARQ